MNIEERKKYNKKYYKNNLEKIADARKEYVKNNREKSNKIARKWNKNNPKQRNKIQRKYEKLSRENIDDKYIKRIIKYSRVAKNYNNYTPEMIEIVRLQIQIKREIKTLIN